MKSRLFCAVLLGSLPVAAVIRTWQMSTAVDSVGFYLPQYESVCNIFGYIALALAALFIVAGRFGLNKQVSEQAPEKSLVLGVAALLLAVSCIPAGVGDWMTQGVKMLIPSVLTAVGFTVFAALQMQGRPVPFGVTVIPVVSEFARLVLNYARFNGIARISENVVHILFLCSFMAFCLACCRGYSGIQSQKGLAYAYGTGGCTALFGVLDSVPAWLAGKPFVPFSLLALAAAIYAVTFVLVMDWQKSPIPAAESTCEQGEIVE